MTWAVMFVCELLVPIIMIVSGIIFSAGAPSEVNSLFGYRTSRSMKNGDTWNFAHRYCGRLWLIIGAVLLPVSVCSSIISVGKSDDFISIFGVGVIVVQSVALLISIIFVEHKLKQTFDKNGNRIN